MLRLRTSGSSQRGQAIEFNQLRSRLGWLDCLVWLPIATVALVLVVGLEWSIGADLRVCHAPSEASKGIKAIEPTIRRDRFSALFGLLLGLSLSLSLSVSVSVSLFELLAIQMEQHARNRTM